MKTILYLTFIGLLFISCTKERIEANGNIISDVRRPGTFTGVFSSGSKEVHITYGNEYKVELRGSSNLVSKFKTRVSNNTLNLNYERVNVVDDDLEVYVTMPAIRNATISGSGAIDIEGAFPAQDSFRARISGSGDIRVHDEFEAEETNVDISGSGDANLTRVLSREAEISISGSGDARVSVENRLKARISGSGKVYYHGNPTIDSKVSGSGNLIRQ